MDDEAEKEFEALQRALADQKLERMAAPMKITERPKGKRGKRKRKVPTTANKPGPANRMAKPLLSGATKAELILQAVAEGGAQGVTVWEVTKKTGLAQFYVSRSLMDGAFRYGKYRRKLERAIMHAGKWGERPVERYRYWLTEKGKEQLRAFATRMAKARRE